jgi:hypothetical protein
MIKKYRKRLKRDRSRERVKAAMAAKSVPRIVEPEAYNTLFKKLVSNLPAAITVEKFSGCRVAGKAILIELASAFVLKELVTIKKNGMTMIRQATMASTWAPTWLNLFASIGEHLLIRWLARDPVIELQNNLAHT